MAYDDRLAQRVRDALRGRRSLAEKKMFGGVAFLVRGNMVCGVLNDDLIVRLGPERSEKALKRKHARPLDVTGRPMKGMVMVAPGGCRTRANVESWLTPALEFTRSLPAK